MVVSKVNKVQVWTIYMIKLLYRMEKKQEIFLYFKAEKKSCEDREKSYLQIRKMHQELTLMAP